jgi:hypothetical protein
VALVTFHIKVAVCPAVMTDGVAVNATMAGCEVLEAELLQGNVEQAKAKSKNGKIMSNFFTCAPL